MIILNHSALLRVRTVAAVIDFLSILLNLEVFLILPAVHVFFIAHLSLYPTFTDPPLFTKQGALAEIICLATTQRTSKLLTYTISALRLVEPLINWKQCQHLQLWVGILDLQWSTIRSFDVSFMIESSGTCSFEWDVRSSFSIPSYSAILYDILQHAMISFPVWYIATLSYIILSSATMRKQRVFDRICQKLPF